MAGSAAILKRNHASLAHTSQINSDCSGKGGSMTLHQYASENDDSDIKQKELSVQQQRPENSVKTQKIDLSLKKLNSARQPQIQSERRDAPGGQAELAGSTDRNKEPQIKHSQDMHRANQPKQS